MFFQTLICILTAIRHNAGSNLLYDVKRERMNEKRGKTTVALSLFLSPIPDFRVTVLQITVSFFKKRKTAHGRPISDRLRQSFFSVFRYRPFACGLFLTRCLRSSSAHASWCRPRCSRDGRCTPNGGSCHPWG